MRSIPLLLQLCVATVLVAQAHSQIITGPFAPADRIVAKGRTITFFNSSGANFGSLAVPWPGGSVEDLRDVTHLADGRLAVFNGIFNPYLSIYDFGTGNWAHSQIAGWSTTNNTRFGGIASLGNYVFLSDDSTSGAGSPRGSIRVDLQTGTSIRYEPSFGSFDVNVGLDGLVYSLGQGFDAAQQVKIYDPNTLAPIRVVTFQSGSLSNWQPNSVAADATGQIYVGNNSLGAIFVFAPDGSYLRTITTAPTVNYVRDLDLRTDGSLLFGTFFEGVFQSNPSQTTFTRLGTTSDGYTAFLNQVPEPSTVLLGIIAAAGIFSRRFR